MQDLPYAEDVNCDLELIAECTIGTLDVSGDTIRMYKLDKKEVMANSGANSCMADTEAYLIGCHDITPITLGLALKLDESAQQLKCSRMGYLPMRRIDRGVHHQPFLINDHATDSIMSPEAIMQFCKDVVHWRQEGFIGSEPGTLKFYGKTETLLSS